MATIVKKLTRLESARADLAEAANALDALRARQLDTGDVDAEAFGAAGDRVRLAELDVEGAEAAEAAAAAAERLSALTALRAEILTRADPGPVIAAAEALTDAVAVIVAALGPQRSREISRQLGTLRDAGVAETDRNGQPAAGDAGLGWHGPGMLNAAPRLRVDDRVIAPVDLGALITALVARGCHRAGEHPAAARAAGASQAIAADPRGWLERNI